MRALLTCLPQLGHFLPLTPIAHAMAEAGHDVAFGTPDSLRAAVEAAGFRWVRAGVENDDPEMAAVWARFLQLRGLDQSKFVYEQIIGGVRPRRMVPDLLFLVESWKPDVFIHDSRECGAVVAAIGPSTRFRVGGNGASTRYWSINPCIERAISPNDAHTRCNGS